VSAEARSGDALARLAALLREEGGLLATLLDGDAHGGGPGDRRATDGGGADAERPAAIVAAGPRTQGRRHEYELLVEAIYEGYLLHYGAPRVVRSTEADLRVLAGDQLYAIGLARLVTLGDTAAVAELADTITLSALAQSAGSPALADAVWAAGARAVGWGPSAAHREAKELAFAGAPGAVEAMRTSAAPPAAPR
jgi:hypothetical protein